VVSLPLFAALGAIGAFAPWRTPVVPLRRRLVLSLVYALTFAVLYGVVLNGAFYVDKTSHPALFATFGPPLLLATILAAGYVEIGFAGGVYSEHHLEWRSRLGALLLRLAVGWLVVLASVVYLPWALRLAGERLSWGALAGWLVTTGGGALVARKAQRWKPGRLLTLVAAVVPPLFLVGLLAIGSEASLLLTDFHRPRAGYVTMLEEFRPTGVLVCLAVVLLVGAACFLLLPATRFSLHSLYLNRLTRCYLGASLRDWNPRRGDACLHDRRQPNDFTGFDPSDDFSLAELKLDPASRTGYLGPYPLFNTTLNLVAGKELAYQDRKGASFVLTPDYCGSEPTGYALLDPKSEDERKNLTLGRAITISGAAIDPNMNVYQSPALTALLTLLNARLGWWLENPDRPQGGGGRWVAGSPRKGGWYYAGAAGLDQRAGKVRPPLRRRALREHRRLRVDPPPLPLRDRRGRRRRPAGLVGEPGEPDPPGAHGLRHRDRHRHGAAAKGREGAEPVALRDRRHPLRRGRSLRGHRDAAVHPLVADGG
jgi:hypothetical protein